MPALRILFRNLFAIIALFSVCLSSHAVQSAEVVLAWDKPDDSRVAGYNVYYGKSGTDYKTSPKSSVDGIDQTNCNISELEEGSLYGFAVTSVSADGQESVFSEDLYYNVPETTDGSGAATDGGTALNFNEYEVISYGGSQDVDSSVAVEDSGSSLHIIGNGWKRIGLSYFVTPDTILEFDFKSTAMGEIHGIGFDTDDTIQNPIQAFQIYGSQSWGYWPTQIYNGSGDWMHFQIPVGTYTALTYKLFTSLTFINDHDVAYPDGESLFKNFRIYDPVIFYEPDIISVNFYEHDIIPYGGAQDAAPSLTIEDGGNTLHIVGNGWKQIDFPYFVTPDTILEFDFKSTAMGDIHGIGFDTDDNIQNPMQAFQIYGSQDWGYWPVQFYDGSGDWMHFQIPVGTYSALAGNAFTALTFLNDHDAAAPDGESFFRNVRCYEPTD